MENNCLAFMFLFFLLIKLYLCVVDEVKRNGIEIIIIYYCEKQIHYSEESICLAFLFYF